MARHIIESTRKDHKCALCERVIPMGSKCFYEKHRVGKRDNNDDQVGIEFWSGWFCFNFDECFELSEAGVN